VRVSVVAQTEDVPRIEVGSRFEGRAAVQPSSSLPRPPAEPARIKAS